MQKSGGFFVLAESSVTMLHSPVAHQSAKKPVRPANGFLWALNKWWLMANILISSLSIFPLAPKSSDYFRVSQGKQTLIWINGGIFHQQEMICGRGWRYTPLNGHFFRGKVYDFYQWIRGYHILTQTQIICRKPCKWIIRWFQAERDLANLQTSMFF